MFALFLVLCFVGACFGARAFFAFIGLLFALPVLCIGLLFLFYMLA